MLATRGIGASLEGLLITTGSQQGLDLVGRVLLDPGDVVLVELPSYTGAITAFRNAWLAFHSKPTGSISTSWNPPSAGCDSRDAV
jgi:2-aminoadipate transaminase